MLSLGRKPGQSLLIGDDIEVVVTRIDPNGLVHLSVKAPRHVAVDRREVRELKTAEQRTLGGLRIPPSRASG